MRYRTLLLGVALGGALLTVFLLPRARAQDADASPDFRLRATQIWNASAEGTRSERGFLELKDTSTEGRWLVLTNLDIRAKTGIYARLVERRPLKKSENEKTTRYKTVVLRPALFMRDFSVSTSGYTGGSYASITGIRVPPGSKIGLEVTQGNGEIWAEAQGYWTSR